MSLLRLARATAGAASSSAVLWCSNEAEASGLQYASSSCIPTSWAKCKLVQVAKYNHDTSVFVFATPDGATNLNLPVCGCLLLRAPGREHGGGDAVRPYTPIGESGGPSDWSHDHIAGPENNDTSVRRRLFGTFLFGEIVKIVLAHALETRHYWLLEVAIDCVVWVLFAHYLLKIRARIRERDQIPGEDGLTEACCAYCCTGCVLCGTMGHELKLVGELYAPTENATRAGRAICCC